ncbi:bifunctional tetrahydrofolate synthase/dihydrofolate synthase [Thalassotalea sp. M1531]|uniref:Dihydrofolate synthase/folylpolyglutamate synthase n=1 Tax=Thalassotalea algicola TaxID=2716224 RepID=A0A7Y0LB99_9GAMM|nr:bifunctional tetrahydrofolate synthase/dihydrofolate synthase [Thalassotalea algicola]NMP31256.1 bifunctional tetrahydrofolate synthase/dihydrofolate synthase [Thalassotalea algicola]
MSKLPLESHCDDWSLSQWLCYLETIHTQEIDLGLDRINRVAKSMSISLDFAKVLTVAGTNGKGTTCAFIENYLLSRNKTVSVYSSPHIERFNERLRTNRVEVEDKYWIAALSKVERARQSTSLTYYEFTTLAAFVILAELSPEYIILEVGLGGRLDATNIINPDIAVLTSVALDHQAFLGNTREAIGYEKAGIFRSGIPAVIGEKDTPTTVLNHAENIGARVIQREYDFKVVDDENSQLWNWQSGDIKLNGLVTPFIPKDNVATAIAVISNLGFELTQSQLNSVISETKVPGRTELFHDKCDVMLDVGHNPHAVNYLAGVLKRLNYSKVHAVVGMLKDKDITATLSTISETVDYWYFASLPTERAATSEEISQLAKVNSNCFDNVKQAYTMAKNNACSDELVLVFGSFFTVAEIRPILLSD